MRGNVATAQKLGVQAMIKYAEELLDQEKITMQLRWKRDIDLLTTVCCDKTPADWMVWMANKPDKTKISNFANDESVSHLPALSASLKLITKIAKQFSDDEEAGEWNKTHVGMLDRSETIATQIWSGAEMRLCSCDIAATILSASLEIRFTTCVFPVAME